VDFETRQIQHIKYVRIAKLVSQAESDYIKAVQCSLRLEAEHRQVLFSQNLLRVNPRCINSLSGYVLHSVKYFVKYCYSGMAHPHFIDIGETKRYC